MLVASAMTWLLVRISPDEPMIIPLPAARPLPASVVSMFTIAGSTLAAIALASSEPLPRDVEPEPVGSVPWPPKGLLPPEGLLPFPLLVAGVVGAVDVGVAAG